MSLLGLDIGTTGVKAVVFREDGAHVTSSYQEYDLVCPQPGHLELDADRVLAAIRKVIGTVAAEMTDDPIRSFGACAMGEAAVPVDAAGRPVAGAIVGFESRGDVEMAELARKIGGDEMFDITGHPYNSSQTIYKILWRQKHTPEVLERAEKFLCFADFAAASLGVSMRTDHSLAARTQALDIHSLDWSDRILDAAGLDRALFAEPIAPGDRVGETGDAAREGFGLPPGCVVGAGLHDQPAGVLGSGVSPGQAMLATGTVICLGVRLKTRPTTRVMVDNNLCYYPAYGEGQRLSIAYNYTGGSLLKWYRDTLGDAECGAARSTGIDPYDEICSSLPEEPTGLLVLPHFAMTGTPWLDPHALGAIFGLRLSTSRKEIVKAILEGVVYEIKLNGELLGNAGVDIDLYRAIGGAARSTTWMQIAADILDRPIELLEVSEVAGFGAALMGARAAGILASEDDVHAFASSRAKVRARIEPRPRNVARYAERYAIYRDLYPTTRELSHRLFPLSSLEG